MINTQSVLGFDHVLLVKEVFSQRVCDIHIRVYFANLYIIDITPTLHLEKFQMATPLYVSGLLLRVIWICVKACIDVTLYDELFITSIIEKCFLSSLVTKDNFDHCPMIHSWITLVPLDKLMARHT